MWKIVKVGENGLRRLHSTSKVRATFAQDLRMKIGG
jgi:hypothetical protein